VSECIRVWKNVSLSVSVRVSVRERECVFCV